MKKILLTCAAFITFVSANSQNADNKWNVGVHGGASQYNGDLGNGFYNFNQAFYGHAGISVSRYLTRHLDATVFLTRGEIGYLQHYDPMTGIATGNFRLRHTTGNLLLRYHFFSPETFIRPYVFVGAGALRQTSLSDNVIGGGFDFALPTAGGGVNFRLGPYFNIQLQEMFMLTTADDVDARVNGMNDMYLFHSVGVTFNIPKLSPRGQTGVGDQIDKCPKVGNGSSKKAPRKGKTKANGEKPKKNKLLG
jgi:OOP family OmpA-OmpF porin